MRSDVVQLKSAHPELAELFIRLRDELNLPAVDHKQQNNSFESQMPLLSQNLNRDAVSKQLDDLLQSIRTKDGFERFLCGPSDDELTRIAAGGPIVFLNISRFGSDAFLISHNNATHLPLPKVEYSDLISKSKLLVNSLETDTLITRRDTNRSMRHILEWLWDVIVEPVLETLGFTKTPTNDNEWPHVWWIPAGLLSMFPIHAAGYQTDAGRTTLDRVISSYAPTARALDHARNRISNRPRANSQTVLMTAMPNTPKQADLSFADEEVRVISDILPTSINRTILRLPTKSQVVENIGRCSVAHFACHGVVDSNPSKSRILFWDWEIDPFSVADMSRQSLDKVEMAYISTCHAAGNRNFRLLDESIHMAAACQLAGFPTVIGSLWQIQDELSCMIAERVYREMLSGGYLDVEKAGRGLHFAIREIRGETRKWGRAKSPFLWGPYIHVGV